MPAKEGETLASHGKSRSRLVWIALVAIGLLAVSATFALAKNPLISVLERASKPSKIKRSGVDRAVRTGHSRFSHFHPKAPKTSPIISPTSPVTPSPAPKVLPPADTTAPQTTIGNGPAVATIATIATFSFSSSEADSSFECRLDLGSWRSCTSPKSYSGLATGVHQFSVRAIDSSKNADATPATQSWTVIAVNPEPPTDTTPPQTTITSGPEGTTTSTSASFAFTSDATGSSFECKLDSGSWGTCNSPLSYPGLTTGSHQFSVRATDAANNVDPTPAIRSWTAEAPAPPTDTTAPETTIAGGPTGTTTSTSASLTFTSSETGSSFECRLDSGAWSACTSPKSYSALSTGGHQFSVRAIDPADNVDPTPASRSWTVEEEAVTPPSTSCTSTQSSLSAVQSAVSSASPGAVICLANGSYGELTLSANKAKPGVIVQAQNPGQATIAGASMSGSYLTLARFNVTDEVTVQPGATGMTVDHNRITGGYMGVNAGPTSSTQINDTRITNNKLVGPFGEDAIRLNRYHDSDGDGIGVLIEGNEITGVRENGNHSDCLQAVWTGDHIVYRKNYLHDNRCQGFFIKDQASLGGVSGPIAGISVEDNLFVRDNEPCAAEAPGCGQPSYFQVFGPYSGFTMRRNTFWGGDQVAVFQEGTGSDSKIENNVIYRIWTNTNMSVAAYANNTRCKRETSEGGSWPASTPGETVNCSPAFNNAATDDLRLIGSDRGVDWAPAEQHYGP